MIKLEDIAKAFSEVKVLTIGDLMLDQYWWGKVDRISPEAPVPVVRLDNVSLNAGGAANVAANLRGLGAEALLVGLVGEDNEGQQLRKELRARNISEEFLTPTKRSTSVKTRVVAHSQHVVRVDREQHHPLSDEEESSILDSIDRAIDTANVVILSDYAKGTLSENIIRATVERSGNRKIPLLIDPKGKDFSKYRGASMLTPNRREALEACRIEEGKGAVMRAGTQLINDLGLDALVITEGEQGMTLFERGGTPVSHKAAAHEIYDVTGAGDTVIACLAVALASGHSRQEAVELANLSAGLVVEQVGTTAISIDGLIKKLSSLRSKSPVSGTPSL